MSEFVKVLETSGFPNPGKQLVEVDDRLVVVVQVDEQFYCVDDVCTHDSGPLAEGELDGDCLVCPRHGARFRVTDGAALTMPATEATQSHEVKVEDGWVYIRLTDD